MIVFESKTPVLEVPPIQLTVDATNASKNFFSILTNSTHKCQITIDLSNSAGFVHSISAPNFFTNSADCIYAKQLYDIPGVFHLPPGEYTMSVSSSLPVYIYEIHLNCFVDDRAHDFGFQPPITDGLPTIECSYNKFVIIPNISAAYGGMWWCIYQALVGINLAMENGLIPIVDYEGGLYASNSIYDPESLPKYWWNYYFEDPYPIHPEQKQQVLTYAQSHLSRISLHRRLNKVLPINDANCYYYNKSMFLRICKRFKPRMHDHILKYMRPLPYVRDYCDTFWLTHNPDKKPIVGVHYRGTDKYSTATAKEDRPIHYEYQHVAAIMKEKLKEENIDEYILYCASDEEPFIEYMKTQFTTVVYNNHPTRSSESTSGIQYTFNTIRFGHTSNQEDLDKYTYVKNLSIHFGSKDTSNYVKGFYALTDCLLFKPCSVMFMSQGNFSNFSSYMMEPTSKFFNLNSLYQPYVSSLKHI